MINFSGCCSEKLLAPVWIYCQKVLPAVYDDSLSYYEAVCKLVCKLNEVIEKLNKDDDAIKQLQAEVDNLRTMLQAWIDGGWEPVMKPLIKQWIDEHLRYVFETVAKQVFFGLTQDGYFVAYIPTSWDDIIFDTGMNYESDDYGRLILRWDVDSVHHVDQTVESASAKPHGATVSKG